METLAGEAYAVVKVLKESKTETFGDNETKRSCYECFSIIC